MTVSSLEKTELIPGFHGAWDTKKSVYQDGEGRHAWIRLNQTKGIWETQVFAESQVIENLLQFWVYTGEELERPSFLEYQKVQFSGFFVSSHGFVVILVFIFKDG